MFGFWKKKEPETLANHLKYLVKDSCKDFIGRFSDEIHRDISRTLSALESTQRRLDALEILIQTLSERNTDALDLMDQLDNLREVLDDINNKNYSSAKSWKELSGAVPKSVRSTKSNSKTKSEPSKQAGD